MSLLREEISSEEITPEERADLQSHFPYAGVKLNELSVQ
jgi:hypothetical protein